MATGSSNESKASTAASQVQSVADKAQSPPRSSASPSPSTSSSSSSDSESESESESASESESPANASSEPVPDLRSRLAAFLPQIAAANAELDRLKARGELEGKTLEDVAEGATYIEMDLGLGVLEEKKSGESGLRTRREEEDEDGLTESGGEGATTNGNTAEADAGGAGVLQTLMGEKRPRQTKAVGIEEVDSS